MYRFQKSVIKKILFSAFVLIFCVDARADFYAKIPEINPGDVIRDYSLFQPPWYPLEELDSKGEKKYYTVNEAGKLVNDPDGEFSLEIYKKKKTKYEEIKYESKEISKKLIFEKVMGSPRLHVADFYGHVLVMKFDLPLAYINPFSSPIDPNKSPLRLEFKGVPPIPGDNRRFYDVSVLGILCGWDELNLGNFNENGSIEGLNKWEGRLIPNLREYSVFLVNEGIAASKHAALLMERAVKKKITYNLGHEALKAMHGKDLGDKVLTWRKKFIDPIWDETGLKTYEDYRDWETCVRSLILTDLNAKRVPAQRAFYRLRDVPELSEPIMLDLIKSRKATLAGKRNMASILKNFSSAHSAHALHQLVKDKDTITAIRAITSLSHHPHGKVKSIILKWLKPNANDIKRSKAILMAGKTKDSELASALLKLYPKAEDDQEKELILRSLMKMGHEGARAQFEENLKSDFDILRYTSNLGKLTLGDYNEDQVLKIMNEAFYREDARPGTGKIVSFLPKFRIPLTNWVANCDLKKPRRKLWSYISGYEDFGFGTEIAGSAPVLTEGLYEIKLGDKIIPKNEAIKVINKIASRTKSDVLMRIAALTRLYELDPKKGLKICDKIIQKFLKGKKVDELADEFDVTPKDLLIAAINITMRDDSKNVSFIEKIMTSPNIGGNVKSLILEKVYVLEKKLSTKIVKKNLNYYFKQSDLNIADRQYFIRLLRFAGGFKDPKILRSIVNVLEKSNDQWVRFICLYSLRLSLGSDFYANVINGKPDEINSLARLIKTKINETSD